MPARIVVAHPRQAAAMCSCADVWAYADENLETFEKVAHALGDMPRLVEAAELQDEARRLLPKFIPWADDQIPLDDPQAWLLSPCHRNPFGNNLFLHIAWLSLIERQLGDRALLVLTESSALARSLQNVCVRHAWGFAWTGRGYFMLGRAHELLRATAVLGRDVVRVLVGMLSVQLLLGKGYLHRLYGVELLVDAYIYPDSFGEDARFHDKHLPGLLEWCRANQISTAVYPFPVYFPLHRLPRLFKTIRQSETNMLPFELLIRFADLGPALVACFRYALRRERCTPLEPIDVAFLVAGARIRAAFAGLIPILMLAAPHRLATWHIRPKWLYEWFENQAMDRANAFAFQKIGCEVIALRPYSLPPMFANLYTSERQYRAGTCPPHAWVGGRAMRELLMRHDRCTRYHLMPALRYQHLYQPDVPSAEGTALLVLLTHSGAESLNILSCIVPALDFLAPLFSAVLVKPHGDYDEYKVRRALAERWPRTALSDRLHWESRPIHVLLNEARMVVSAGSGAALEAVCGGIPVISIGRQAGLDMNPLQDVDDRLWVATYNDNQFRRAITTWSPAHPMPLRDRRELGREIRDMYFEPADDSGMVRLDPRKLEKFSGRGETERPICKTR